MKKSYLPPYLKYTVIMAGLLSVCLPIIIWPTEYSKTKTIEQLLIVKPKPRQLPDNFWYLIENHSKPQHENDHKTIGSQSVLSVRFEVGVSLLLGQAGADRRAGRPQGPFSSSGKCRNTASNSLESTCQSSSKSQILLKALPVAQNKQPSTRC